MVKTQLKKLKKVKLWSYNDPVITQLKAIFLKEKRDPIQQLSAM